MFDTVAGKGQMIPSGKPLQTALVSVVGHVVIVGGLAVVPLLFVTNNLPTPPTMLAFIASPSAAPPPPPPPPPPAPAPARAEAPRPKPLPTTGKLAAPVEAPVDIAEEPDYDEGEGEGEGVIGGVEGGVPGGVLGGILGGLPSNVPPPPPPPPAPAPPEKPTPVRVGGNIQAPALVRRVEPVYPLFAQVTHIEGMVILEAIVNESGSVETVRVLRSVPALDQAAIDAVKQWQYSPLILNGRPAPFVLTVMLSFKFTDRNNP
jgi:protein TonB